ncbi:MAG: PilZ domain-containing protein [Sphingomonas sp.]|nr:PilZ domain-containing protein [Sphingomonas sp.]
MQHRRIWVPRNERVRDDVDATVHRRDDSEVAVRLINMSFEGCGMAAGFPFEAGERVRIAIVGQGYIEAEMRWSCDERAGAVFLCECHV